MDLTGYECFVNHLHIDDYTDENFFLHGLGLIMAVAGIVRNKFPQKHFRFILAQEKDSSCNVRFHCRRKGEEWLSEDIDQYREDGILVMDF